MTDFILRAQSLVLLKNSPWFAIAFLGYSLINSWHCALMCGGLTFESSRTAFHRILFWRLISYSAVGGLLGFSGATILESAEFQVVRGMAFFAMLFICLISVFPRVISFSALGLRELFQASIFRSHPRIKGILFAGMPCHFLITIYAGAVLSGSAFVGAMILFAHAVMTMPSLAFSWNRTLRVSSKWKVAKTMLRYFVVVVMIINLIFFGSSIFLPEKDAEKLMLFCF